MSGLGRVIALEYPKIETSLIDLDLEVLSGEERFSSESMSSLLFWLRDLTGKKYGQEFSVRGLDVFERHLEPVALTKPSEFPFRDRGTYLIVGGSGGIGHTVARHLAAKVHARLVLIGRSAVDAKRQAEHKELEDLGAEVLYIQADATDQQAMHRAVQSARQRFGSLSGVIHSAIVLDDKTIERLSEQSFRAALDPKVAGCIATFNAVAAETLDFFAFFSSAASFMGSIGQSNYLAGSSFEDAFGHYLASRFAIPVKILNWGFWGSVGVVASAEYRAEAQARGMGSIEPDEGLSAFDEVIASTHSQVIAIKASPSLLELMGAKGSSLSTKKDHLLEDIRASVLLYLEQRAFSYPINDAQQLESIGRLSLLKVFRELGVFFRSGERYRLDHLKKQLNISAQYYRLFDQG